MKSLSREPPLEQEQEQEQEQKKEQEQEQDLGLNNLRTKRGRFV